MAVIDDFVVESCTASGTTISLTGRWSGGCRTFAESNVGNGNPCRIKVEYIDPATGKPEGEGATAIATYNSGPQTLSITTWLKTRSGGATETWVGGKVYRVYLTADSDYLEGGRPGGASGQPQYNNGGAFGGMSGVSWTDGTKTLTMAGGVKTTSQPSLVITQTYNAAGTQFFGSGLDITATAQATDSRGWYQKVNGNTVAWFGVHGAAANGVGGRGWLNLEAADGLDDNAPGLRFRQVGLRSATLRLLASGFAFATDTPLFDVFFDVMDRSSFYFRANNKQLLRFAVDTASGYPNGLAYIQPSHTFIGPAPSFSTDNTVTFFDGTATTGDLKVVFRSGAARPARVGFAAGSNVMDVAWAREASGMMAVVDGSSTLTNYRDLKLRDLYSGANRVVSARNPGWSTWTGTASKAAQNADATQTISAIPTQAEVEWIRDRLMETRQGVKALIDALHETAGHGLIGS